MIRDITIGQYYPAKSVVHRLGSESKTDMYTTVSDLAFLIQQYSGISCGNGISDLCDPHFQSSFFLYCKRTEAGDHAAYDHSII